MRGEKRGRQEDGEGANPPSGLADNLSGRWGWWWDACQGAQRNPEC